uniref:Uncharacterized protein n=1 Tax=Rhizophora mucronata TaxID=61149 RepID=A0A2P2R0V1_RHIMU
MPAICTAIWFVNDAKSKPQKAIVKPI